MRVQIIPRPVGRLGLGLGSGPRVGGLSLGVFLVAGLSPGSYLQGEGYLLESIW